MKLATFNAPDGAGPYAGVVSSDGRIRAFAEGDGVRDHLAGARTAEDNLGEWRLDEVELLAPLLVPGTIYGIGLNYARHVEETGAKRPEQPIVFVKVAGSSAPPQGPVRKPDATNQLDYEGELTIVIGAGGRIAGYCVADDVTARDLQGSEAQWTRAKGADAFCPYGPWITTADEVPDPESLSLRTWVNDELRQDANTSDLIFGCREVVDYIAQTCTLRPGDLILTGTPNGVGVGMDPPRFLAPGDTVRIEIEGLGTIEHGVVAS